jgi:PAS domain S-box-containing protein
MVEEETFAGSVADLTVRALEGIEHRRLELFQAATLRIAEAASKDRDLEALSRLVCATLAEATAARAVHIVVRDPETEALSEILATPTAHLDGAHARGVAKAIDRVYRGGQLLRCDGAELASLAGMEAEAVTGNWIGVPLLSDAGTLGVLMLEWDHGPEDSSPVLQRFLSEAALHLAHAIERTQREQALRARTRQQAAVAELGLQALGVADIPALLDTVVRLAARTLDVEFSKVLELQPGSETLLLRAGVGWQSGLVGRATVGSGRESQAGYTLLHGGPVIVRDLRTETRFNGPRLLIDHGIVSGISTVIQTRLERRFVLGVHTARKRVFSWDDAMFVQAIANVVAAAMLRLQAQSALQASEERLQRALERVEHARALQEDHDFTLLVVNGLPQSISVIDAEGRYEFVNPAGLRLLGFEERDVLGHKASEFVHPEDQAAIQRAMDDRRAGHTTTYEVRFVDKNGAIKAALVTGAPRFRGGHFAGTVAVAVDLGPLKMAQEQVLALEIEARRREREARLQVVQAQEEERVLLSREIHDGLGQLMVGLHLGLVARSHERQDLVEEISIARSAVSAAGRLSRRLHPPELDNSSVFSVVVEQLCTPQNAAGPRVHARSHGQEPALDRSRRGLLYRIACLAVERSVHVAHATHVDLVFEWSAQQLTLRVEDDGVPAPEDDAGIALRGIHDRAALLDGDVQATHAGDRNRLLITLRLAAH